MATAVPGDTPFGMLEYQQALEEDGRDHFGHKLDGAYGLDQRIPEYSMTYDQWSASVTPPRWKFWRRTPNLSYAAYRRYVTQSTKDYEQAQHELAQAQAVERKRLAQILNSEPLPAIDLGLAPTPRPTLTHEKDKAKRPKRIKRGKAYSETTEQSSHE